MQSAFQRWNAGRIARALILAPAFQLVAICHRFNRPRPDPVTIPQKLNHAEKCPALFPLAFLVSICYYVFMIVFHSHLVFICSLSLI
jgi:hypothetical protein